MIIFDFWFIIFSCFIIAGGVIASEVENFTVAVSTFIIGLVGLQWFFSIPVWGSIVDNPFSLLLYLLIYTIVGAAYTILWRWPEYIRENSVRISYDYKEYIARNPADSKEDFLNSRYYAFSTSKHKQGIATWILAWPFSLFWELGRKPFKYAYNGIYTLIGDLLERVGRNVANKIISK